MKHKMAKAEAPMDIPITLALISFIHKAHNT